MNTSAVAGWDLAATLNAGGHVYAQPLYVESITWPDGRKRDVLYVATSTNAVIAFNAVKPFERLWTTTLGPPDRSTILGPGGTKPGCNFLSPGEIGIEATPVIDRSTHRLYVSYRTNPSDGPNPDVAAARQKLAALDLVTGQRAVPTDADMPLPEPDLHWERVRNRSSLLLANGVVYVAFGSRCEDPGQPIFHGWISAHSADSLAQVGTHAMTHGAVDGAGIWQGSVGLAADEAGSVYFGTGNARFGSGGPFNDPTNLSDSIVRLKPRISRDAGGSVQQVVMDVADWFTPYRRRWMDEIDLDLGSSGVVLIPGSPYLMGAGKQGVLYVLNRNDMGHGDVPNAWDDAKADGALDGTYADFPEQFDNPPRVAQKFRVGINQYIPPESPNFAPAGAHIATAAQNDRQLDAFMIGNSGAVLVTSEVDDGGWHQPVPITPEGRAPPGRCVTVARASPDQLDAFYVGNDGAVWMSWLQPDGKWTDARDGRRDGARITPPGRAVPGNCVAVAWQKEGLLDAFVTGTDGAIWVTWNDGRFWTDGAGHPDGGRITPAHTVPRQADVDAIKQGDTQLDVFAIDDNGTAIITWESNDGWQPQPKPISPTGMFPSGSHIRAVWQSASQLNAIAVDTEGRFRAALEQNNGAWAQEPVAITPPRVAPPGAHFDVFKGNQDNQLELLWVGPGNSFWVSWIVSNLSWQAPIRFAQTPCARFSPGSSVSVARQNAAQVDVFAVDVHGAAQVSFKLNDGAWNVPIRLHAALPMCDWPLWPHVHGSPVIADFSSKGRLMYVWPEKDHLKAFRWMGDHFDEQGRILARDLSGRFVLAPPGPSPTGTGMPGGMLSVAVDPAAQSGVLFASVPRPENQELGILRAFDPLTLKEVWNNDNRPASYKFAKFVPATPGRNVVFLATADRGILVYGRH